VHWPDGHYTDGIDMHTQDMAALFAWAPDLRIETHPLRVAKDNLTALTGVMKGTFTQPAPDGTGGTTAPPPSTCQQPGGSALRAPSHGLCLCDVRSPRRAREEHRHPRTSAT